MCVHCKSTSPQWCEVCELILNIITLGPPYYLPIITVKYFNDFPSAYVMVDDELLLYLFSIFCCDM